MKATIQIWWLSLCLFSIQLRATTIDPFADLGALTHAAPIIVYGQVERFHSLTNYDREQLVYQIKVLESIKGETASSIQLLQGTYRQDSLWTVESGMLNLEEGVHYLFFLRNVGNRLEPFGAMAYVFEEFMIGDTAVLLPSKEGAHLHEHVHHDEVEPLVPYITSAILPHLRAIARGLSEWNQRQVMASRTLQKQLESRADPSGCGYLGSSVRFKWQDFESTPVQVHYSGTDPNCISYHQLIGEAVASINNNYPGVNLVYAGQTPQTYNPDCSGNIANGSHLRSWIQSNLGGSRHIVIQFDDPCGQMNSPTLGVGGLSGTSLGAEVIDGIMYYAGQYGTVVLDETADCASASDYRQLVIHELTHALGIGHHAQSGNNMFGTCCAPITQADITCANFVYYEGQSLPITLSEFAGAIMADHNRIYWHLASAYDVDRFEVERSIDLATWELVSTLPFQPGQMHYQVKDLNPLHQSYYRLRSVDLDGTEQYSEIIQLENEEMTRTMVLLGNPVRDRLQIMFSQTPTGQLRIYNLAGQLIKRLSPVPDLSRLEIDLTYLAPGSYLLQYRSVQGVEVLPFIKT